MGKRLKIKKAKGKMQKATQIPKQPKTQNPKFKTQNAKPLTPHMYSTFELALKYVKYFLTASNGKGHGVHSPFVFEFITKVLSDKKSVNEYGEIEEIRNQLLLNDTVLHIHDFGAGSTTAKTNDRKVKEIAGSSLKPAKFAQLFHRVVKYYQPKSIIELGTSLGVTTSYLASGNKAARVYTFEGAKQVAEVSRKNFEQLSLKNVDVIEGNFNETLAVSLVTISSVDLAYVDGNHRKEPTINYFLQLLEKVNEQSIIIFDDIHWSKEMEEAWDYIKSHSRVTLTIDLFFVGFIFFRKEQKVQQHFTIRF